MERSRHTGAEEGKERRRFFSRSSRVITLLLPYLKHRSHSIRLKSLNSYW